MIDRFLLGQSDRFPYRFLLATRTFKVAAESDNEKENTFEAHGRKHGSYTQTLKLF